MVQMILWLCLYFTDAAQSAAESSVAIGVPTTVVPVRWNIQPAVIPSQSLDISQLKKAGSHRWADAKHGPGGDFLCDIRHKAGIFAGFGVVEEVFGVVLVEGDPSGGNAASFVF